MPDWEAPDENEWNEGGGTPEEQAQDALSIMGVFLTIKELPQDQMEDMLATVERWRKKFEGLPASRLKDVLNGMYLRVRLHIALNYLDMFLKIEEVDRETCAAMNYLLEIITTNRAAMDRFFVDVEPTELEVKVDRASLKISGTHPEVLDGEE